MKDEDPLIGEILEESEEELENPDDDWHFHSMNFICVNLPVQPHILSQCLTRSVISSPQLL